MSKCLVTKLNVVVDNDNLPVFGQLKSFLNTGELVADVGITSSIDASVQEIKQAPGISK